jgi:hypothetical protein
MKPFSVRAETRIGISGPAYEGARTKRKNIPALLLSLALALAGRFHFNPPASPVSMPLVIESAAREILCQGFGMFVFGIVAFEMDVLPILN